MSRDQDDAEEGFLNRWARRKSAVERGEAADATAEPGIVVEEASPSSNAALEEKPEEEVLAELGLPRPEDLQPGDGVGAFMRDGVPEYLKRRALRRLWSLNPALANLDALVEYGEDYTDAALAVANVQTVYQVGSGYRTLFEDDEEDAEDLAAPNDDDDAAEEPDAPPAAEEARSEVEPDPDGGEQDKTSEGEASSAKIDVVNQEAGQNSPELAEQAPESHAVRARKKMRFDF